MARPYEGEDGIQPTKLRLLGLPPNATAEELMPPKLNCHLELRNVGDGMVL